MPGQRRGSGTTSGARQEQATAGDVVPLSARRELALARQVRARELVIGTPVGGIAARIRSECEPAYGTTRIRAYRLALGITLADVVAQVKAWYEAEGRMAPRFGETLLSAYESGQKRPGTEYLHYLCSVYRADPQDLGYQGRCLCGGGHRAADGPAGWTSPAATPAAITGLPGSPLRATEADTARERRRSRGPSLTSPDGTGASGRRAGAGAPRPEADGVPGVLAAARVTGPGTPAAAAEDDEDILRTALLRLQADAGAEADGTFFGAADRIRRRMDDALLAGRASAAVIDRWEEAAAGYARQYMTAPPLRLLCDTLLDFADIRRACAERQPVESAERLCRLAGRLAGLAGIIMINLGDPRLARSFFRTARSAADETEDRGLRAWVTAREALVPLYYGEPDEAFRLAGSAVDLAGRQPCVAGAMAQAVAARAAARMAGRGRRDALDQALRMLDRAHETLADLPEQDRADTAFGYTERQLFFYEGDTLVMLGDFQRAGRAFAQALRRYAAGEFLDRTLISLGQARCLLESGEPEQALGLSRDALLRRPREQRPPIVVRAAQQLGRAAAARHAGLPAVREYREALLTG
jgi:tetratricopeptide (TPR) repeat protein/transcriptional regulator with XRE-family HTH domain